MSGTILTFIFEFHNYEMSENCYHCGTACGNMIIRKDNHSFCCMGCKTVYELLQENELSYYYELANNPGSTPSFLEGKYDFLDNPKIVSKLVDFDDGGIQTITLYIPSIHCSSCIWVLENLRRLRPEITSSQVDFPKKTLLVTFHSTDFNLKNLVLLLCTIGYEPYISLNEYDRPRPKQIRRLIYQLGLAGFVFGNVMLLSFPEYFSVSEFWLNQYKPFFRWLVLGLSLPVVFYSALDYYTSAIKGLTSRTLNIDVPISLGIIVLFIRSTWEVTTGSGPGFFDSLTGLVFFLLLGKVFQQRTYGFLSFERDYKSYFPVGITLIDKLTKEEKNVPIYDIKKGDLLLIRHKELIPVDGILIKGYGLIDYSFVTGEEAPIYKKSGDLVFAGGKQTGEALEIEATSEVSQSYLTQLWKNSAFDKNKNGIGFQNLTDRVGKYFTPIILAVALTSYGIWYFIDPTIAWTVFTAVLIIACPCALALSAPFTLGNILRIFGKKGFYLKDAQVVEKMAQLDTLLFDKTGTLTLHNTGSWNYEGTELDEMEKSLLKTTLRNSNHPLSRQLYDILKEYQIEPLDSFEEQTGRGIKGVREHREVVVGSAEFVGLKEHIAPTLRTAVFVGTESGYKGQFSFYNRYREGLGKLFLDLIKRYKLTLLSGDNDSERPNLNKLLPEGVKMLFNQNPENKLEYVSYLQNQGAKVMMVGDGLNDAGALAKSNVGVAVAENVNVFTPACDGILQADRLRDLNQFLRCSRRAIGIVQISFVLSFFYNIIGLSFAVSGALSPLIAAIIMPLSSITVVSFATGMSYWVCRKLK